MTAAPDPGRHLLDRIDAREQALTCEAGQAQARIDELTARLRELNEAISDLQITRKTLSRTDCPVPRAGRVLLRARRRAGSGAGRHRDRDRPRAVGQGAGRGRVPGVPGEPEAGIPAQETVAVSGKKDDFFDASCLADMGRTRRHQMRELAADSDIAEAVKIAARAHQKLIWERTRHLLRMRSALREYFPAALEAYAGLTLTGADTLELLGKAPDPASAARLTAAQITAALRRAGRRGDLAQRATGHPDRAAHCAPDPARRHHRGVRRVGTGLSRRDHEPSTSRSRSWKPG